MCQERLKCVTSGLPVIALQVPHVLRHNHSGRRLQKLSYIRILWETMPITAIAHAKVSPIWVHGSSEPLRALIWHLTVHQPSHIALSCVSLLPASALFA